MTGACIVEGLSLVAEFTTRLEAEAARERLTAAGVQSIVTADDLAGMAPAPFQPGPQRPRLFVAAAELARAKRLLETPSGGS